MRGLCRILLLVAALLQLLLGAVYLMSARYQPVASQAQDGLSPGRQLTLGIVVLAAALALMAAAVLGSLRRATRVTLVLVGMSAVVVVGTLVIDGAQTVVVLSLVLVLLALGGLVLAGWRLARPG